MGWLRLAGSLKLQVSLAEHSPFYRALLQKRPMILRSLPIEATTYDSRHIQIIGLFCRILSPLQGSFAKKTYYFKEPTNPI